jgi:hypothetical protein
VRCHEQLWHESKRTQGSVGGGAVQYRSVRCCATSLLWMLNPLQDKRGGGKSAHHLPIHKRVCYSLSLNEINQPHHHPCHPIATNSIQVFRIMLRSASYPCELSVMYSLGMGKRFGIGLRANGLQLSEYRDICTPRGPPHHACGSAFTFSFKLWSSALVQVPAGSLRKWEIIGGQVHAGDEKG